MSKFSPSNPFFFFLFFFIVHPNVILGIFNETQFAASCFWSEHFLTLIWFGEEASLTVGWVCNDGATGQGNDCNDGLEGQMSIEYWMGICLFGILFSTIYTGREIIATWPKRPNEYTCMGSCLFGVLFSTILKLTPSPPLLLTCSDQDDHRHPC